MKRRAVPYARCTQCELQGPLDEMMLSERGIVCVLCAQKFADEAPPEVHRGREGLWASVRSLFLGASMRR